MNDVIIPMAILKKHDLTVNEYLILYNLVNNHTLSVIFDYSVNQLTVLESKGFIKLTPEQICLREKTEKIFSVNTDLFVKWLDVYPVKVKKQRTMGTRALSPKDPNTILGKRLRAKWNSIFKKDIEAQKQAIQVLELQLKDMEKSGDLEFMVEAARWLNEGYHEKYSYLLDEDHSGDQYVNEDYL